MKLMNRLLLWILAVFVPIVIAACYGVPYRYVKSGRVLDHDTKRGVAGIDVICLFKGHIVERTTTAGDGGFQLADPVCDSLHVEDGSELNPYQRRTIHVVEGDDFTIEIQR